MNNPLYLLSHGGLGQALPARLVGLLAEMVGNIATVRSFGGEPAVKQRYDETQEQWKVTRDMLHKVEWRSTLMLNAGKAVGVCAAVGLAARSALAGDMTAGDILPVLTLTQSLITTIAPIARQINQADDIKARAERLVELLDVDTELADRPQGRVRRHPGTDTAPLAVCGNRRVLRRKVFFRLARSAARTP